MNTVATVDFSSIDHGFKMWAGGCRTSAGTGRASVSAGALQRHVQLKLRLVKPDDRVEIIGPCLGRLSQTVEQFDRPPLQPTHAEEISRMALVPDCTARA